MSEEKNLDKSKSEALDPKAKYLEALEKKRQGSGVRKNGVTGGPKVSGGEASGKTCLLYTSPSPRDS